MCSPLSLNWGSERQNSAWSLNSAVKFFNSDVNFIGFTGSGDTEICPKCRNSDMDMMDKLVPHGHDMSHPKRLDSLQIVVTGVNLVNIVSDGATGCNWYVKAMSCQALNSSCKLQKILMKSFSSDIESFFVAFVASATKNLYWSWHERECVSCGLWNWECRSLSQSASKAVLLRSIWVGESNAPNSNG